MGITHGVPNRGVLMPPVPQASSILASLGQAAFLWDLTADTIDWSDNAGAVFTDIPAEALARGAAFPPLIEPPPGPRGLDGGARLRVCRARRQAGARARHRPCQQ